MPLEPGLGGGVPPNFLYKQLSRFPSDLLRWFGIPQGQNPQELRPDYQPVLDLWDWLVSSSINAELSNQGPVPVGGAITGTFTTDTLTTQHLYVRDFTLRTQPIPAGGGNFAMVPSIQPLNGAGVEVVLGDRASTLQAGAATVGELVIAHAHNFFVGPNAVLGGIITCNTVAGAFNVFSALRCVNLSR